MTVHVTAPVQVWVDVDLGCIAVVAYLNTLPGVRTLASCQGTIGEGGPEPYRAQVMAFWPQELEDRLATEFDIDPLGAQWGYLRPKCGAPTFAGFAHRAGAVEAVPDRQYPKELTPVLREALGAPNFRTGPISHALRAFSGWDIPERMEDEQATVLHWFVNLALEFGESWGDRAYAYLKEQSEKWEKCPECKSLGTRCKGCEGKQFPKAYRPRAKDVAEC